MTKYNQTGWANFSKKDNASVLDFLSTTASVLVQHNAIGTREIDSLRIALSELQSNPSNNALILELLDQESEFLGIVVARFGETNFNLNLLHYTLKSEVLEIQKLLANLGTEILSKSKLMFNRPVNLFDGQRVESRTLYSKILTDFAENIEILCSQIALIGNQFEQFLPHDMGLSEEIDFQIDSDLKDSLGFATVQANCFAKEEFANAKKHLAQILVEFSEYCEALVRHIAANIQDKGEFPAVVASELLRSESQKILALSTPLSSSMLTWELRRNNLGSSLAGINKSVKNLIDRTTETIAAANTTPVFHSLSESYKRRLVTDLISAGTPPASAWDAINALVVYMQKNDVLSNQLIESELSAIHRSLLPRTLTTLIKLDQNDTLMNKSTCNKEDIEQRGNSLSTKFQNRANLISTLLLTFIFFYLSGCGLKTSVTSDELELRPDIPYKKKLVVPEDQPLQVPWETPIIEIIKKPKGSTNNDSK